MLHLRILNLLYGNSSSKNSKPPSNFNLACFCLSNKSLLLDVEVPRFFVADKIFSRSAASFSNLASISGDMYPVGPVGVGAGVLIVVLVISADSIVANLSSLAEV